MLARFGHAKPWNTTAASRQLARPMAWEVSSMVKAGQLLPLAREAHSASPGREQRHALVLVLLSGLEPPTY
jgi:hypothetical protein